jgi:hypothetical protein
LGFVLGGALLFALQAWWPDAGPRTRIAVSRAAVAGRAAEMGVHGEAGLARLLEAAIDDEILYREGLARGLGEDPVVRRRLVQNMRFAAEAGGSDDDLHRGALALGLHESDAVVRRRVIERMRAALAATAEVEPSEVALRARRTRGGELAVPRVRLTQIYLGAGNQTSAAARLLQRLGARSISTDQATRLGAPLPVPAHLPPLTQRELAARFGDALAAAALALPERQWSAPVRSPYGTHLLWVHDRLPGAAPDDESLRAAAREEIERERAARAVRQALAGLRARYDVDVTP